MPEMSVSVKCTFLDVRAPRASGAPERARSSPPGRVIAERGDREATRAQMMRLDAIVQSSGKAGAVSHVEAQDATERSSGKLEAPSHAQNRSSDSPTLPLEMMSDGGSCSLATLDSPTSSDRRVTPAHHHGAAARVHRTSFGDPSPSGSVTPAWRPAIGSSSRSEAAQLARGRPCKGKRERLNRAMAAIERKISEDPDLFSSGELRLPAFFEQNPPARARIMAQLAEVAAEAYRSIGDRLGSELD